MTIKIWGQEVEDTGTHYRIFIKKPIYGHCVAINSKIITQAEAHHKLLIVSCPGASEEISPHGWVWKSQKISKVFRDPKHPMALFQAHIGEASPDKRKVQNGEQLQLL